MALSGVHFVIRYPANVAGNAGAAALPGGIVGSQTMGSASTSNLSAPIDGVIGSVNASAAIFYSYGDKPDATSGARCYFDPAASPREDFVLNAGDRLAWVLA